jgi:3-oxoacyl-(acyl-carrier-protein) synthase
MLRKLLTPSATYALTAAGQAIRDGNVEGNDKILQACGLYVGSLSLDLRPDLFIQTIKESLNQNGQFNIVNFATRGTKFLDPLILLKLLPNGGLCGIAIEYQVYGSNCNITNGTLSGLQAVITAASAIRRREVDIAIAGGYDCLLQMNTINEFMKAGWLSTHNQQPQKACRPFDSHRDGFVLGEGAAFLLLEAESHAVNRSANVYGEIIGTGQSTGSDAFLKKNVADGCALAQAARHALESGNSRPSQPNVIYGDGLATEEDDRMEANAYKQLFGEKRPFFTAATGSIGFTGAASGVFSLVHALAGLHQDVMFPMINCDNPDPACDLPFVHTPRDCRHNRALVWNSDRGIKNGAVLLGKV